MEALAVKVRRLCYTRRPYKQGVWIKLDEGLSLISKAAFLPTLFHRQAERNVSQGHKPSLTLLIVECVLGYFINLRCRVPRSDSLGCPLTSQGRSEARQKS